MTKSERAAVHQAAERISELSSLENCGLNAATKEEIRLYMQWFDSVAEQLKTLCKADENGSRYDKQDAIDYIMRYFQ